jgi:Ice-binding-like
MKKLLMLTCMLSTGSLCWAQAPSLGTAATFAVLGGTAVTCTSSVITGDVGSSGGAATVVQTGCPITGSIIAPVPAQVVTDFNAAYAALAVAPCTQTILTAAFTGATLGPLAPGVYCFPEAVTFTDTTLTLAGPSTGIWIFKVGAALTGSGFQVVMTNGGQACNVFWAVGAAATLSTSTLPPLFQGNILAGDATGGSLTITGGALVGRALASVAVTLTSTNVNGVCALVDQAKASCKNDDDDRDEDKDHHDKDDDRDKDHHHHHHDKDKDHQDNDHKN